MRDLSDGARRRLRHRLRACKKPAWISRFTDAARRGRVLPQGARAARRRCRAYPSLRGRTRPQHSACRMPSISAGSSRRWSRASRRTACSTATMLSAIPSQRACCDNTMAQIALLRRGDDGLKAARDVVVRSARHGRAAQALWRDDERARHRLRSRRGPRAAGAAHAGSRSDGRRPDASRLFTLLHGARGVLLNLGKPGGIDIGAAGAIASMSSTPITTAHGSFRSSERLPRQAPCWCGPTGMWPGWGMRASVDFAEVLTRCNEVPDRRRVY